VLQRACLERHPQKASRITPQPPRAIQGESVRTACSKGAVTHAEAKHAHIACDGCYAQHGKPVHLTFHTTEHVSTETAAGKKKLQALKCVALVCTQQSAASTNGVKPSAGDICTKSKFQTSGRPKCGQPTQRSAPSGAFQRNGAWVEWLGPLIACTFRS